MVCARCSDYKAELQYDGNRPNRVCQECFIFLTGHTVLEDREGKHRGILEVSSSPLCLPSPCPLSTATHPGLQPGSPSLALQPQQEGWESLPPQSEGACVACRGAAPSLVLQALASSIRGLPSAQNVSSTVIARTAPHLPLLWGVFCSGQGIPQEIGSVQCLFYHLHRVLRDLLGFFWQKGAAEVSSRSLLCSSLQLLDKNGKGGTRGWFVIPQDDPLVLYIYAAPQVRPGSNPPPGDIPQCPRDIQLCPCPASHRRLSSWQDVRAHTSIPLLGYQVRDMPQSESRHLFQLAQSRQVFTFVADTEELKQRWMKAMARSAAGITDPEEEEEGAGPCDEAE